MTQYEVGKKYKKIVTVAKIHNDAPSVLVIDDKRYVLEAQRNAGKDGKHGHKNKKETSSR
ncbi:hypothetical protein [Paenibacillus sp. P32E]|uniref:hypothetical protein n=1 Tax=Paenibacillus sp. P32E TaxID=1349434 RepID=UPI00093E9D20|nr:hypothetical protein [Paenibacillus sp. P32E]OKP94793.1 hypothetical protein A3848_02130 [Paenibacillus sp. P32E]